MEKNKITEGNYITLKDDIEAMHQLIDKYVIIKLIKNTMFTGFVHSIDPVSFSIIISTPKDQSYQTVLLPGHAILDVTECESNADAKPPMRKTSTVNNESNRKERVVQWLKCNLLPVSEEEDKIIVGSTVILPPYSVLDICTNNPMVALQMRKVMEKMPVDFNSLP